MSIASSGVPIAGSPRHPVRSLSKAPGRRAFTLCAIVSFMFAGCSSNASVPVHELKDDNLRTLVGGVFWMDHETVAFAAQRDSDRIDFDADALLNQTSPACVMSAPWMDATVVWSCRTSGTELNSVWVIDPDTASVSETKVPLMPSTTLLSPVPTARGMMFISSRSADDNGLFTFREGERRIVVPGNFQDAVVSPSGCRVAVFDSPSGANEDRRLLVADICKG